MTNVGCFWCGRPVILIDPEYDLWACPDGCFDEVPDHTC